MRLFAIALLTMNACSSDEDVPPPCDPKAVHGVRVSTRGEQAQVCVGEVLQVHADRWSCSTHVEATAELIWSAEPATIATVEGGRVTGVSAGQVTVVATSAGDRDSIAIEVRVCPDAGTDAPSVEGGDGAMGDTSSDDASSDDAEDAAEDAG